MSQSLSNKHVRSLLCLQHALCRNFPTAAQVADGCDALSGLAAQEAPLCMRVRGIADKIDLLEAFEHGGVQHARREARADDLGTVKGRQRLSLLTITDA